MDKESLKAKCDELSKKVKETANAATTAGKETKESLDKKISDVKGDLVATREKYRNFHERGKSKLNSKLLELQMNIEETRKNIEEMKLEHDKERAEKQLIDIVDYADACAELSILAMEEATLAYLEAVELQMEYEEEFGEE